MRISKINTLCSLSVVVAFLLACFPTKQEAEISHDANKYTTSNSAAQWVSHDRKFLRSWFRKPESDFLAASHPASQHIQQWVEVLDAAVRQHQPEQMKNVPKPEIVIVASTEVNANSFAVPLCFAKKVILPKGGNQATVSEVEFVFNEAHLKEPDSYLCLRQTENSDLLAAMVANYNTQTGEHGICHLKLTETSLSFAGDCGQIPTATEASGIRLSAISTNLLVTTALLRDFSEDEFVAAIAHEMGHYYRAHAIMPPNQYAYFYKHNPSNISTRPQPVTDAEAILLGKQLRELGAIPYYEAIPGQRIHRTPLAYVLLNPIGMMGQPFAASAAASCGILEPCKQTCNAFANLWKSEFDHTITVSSPKSLSAEQSAAYLAIEASFLACAANLKLDGRGRPASLDINSLFAALPPALVARAGETIRARRPNNLAAALEIYSEITQEAESKYVAVVKQARQNSLAYYTGEQEADDLAIEILSRTGVDPHAAVLMMLKALKTYSSPIDPGQWDYQTCTKARDAGWREGTTDIVPPVGDWSAYHHSSCYRVYNMEREIRAHKFPVATSRRPTFAMTWSEMQVSLP